MSLKHEQTAGTFHLEKISGNFGWELNGKRFFDSFHRKIPGKGRTSKKVSPFFRLERSERIFVFHYPFLVFHASSRSTERNLPRSFWEKVASLSVDQCTICLFSGDSMKSLSNHECLSLGIGKYLVFEKICSNAHLHFGCPQ